MFKMHWTQTSCLIILFLCLLRLCSRVGCESELNQKYGDESSYEIVFPERIFSENYRSKRSMDDRTEEEDDHLTYKIKGFGKDLVLDLQKNMVTASKVLPVRSYDKLGEEVVDMFPVQNCQYQGQIQGEPDSTVILDACDGLRGIIDDDEEELIIEPIKSMGINAHKLSRTAKEEKFNCGVKSNTSEELYGKERSRRSLAIHPRFRPHMKKIVKKTRYTEVIIVIDNPIYKKYNKNTTEVTRRVITLINAIDMIYQKINIRIILKEIEIWSKRDLVPFNKNAGPDLAGFQKYKENNPNRYKSDTVHLLRGVLWDDHGGMAYKTEMCTVKSTGVVYWHDWSPLGPFLGLSHEMGHNFGFDHDADDKSCKCLTPRGCIMNTFKTRVPGFSDCNLRDLANIDDSCLYNIPQQVKNPRCGNGIKELNEECDCGTKENCAIVDPCCEPSTCKLYPSSQCSNLHDKCCRNCQIAPAGTVCRKAKGRCDVPEQCNGRSSKCPSDDFKMDGEPCFYNDMLLPANKQSILAEISPLPRKIRARHVRINPRTWENDICMRAEVFGCERIKRGPQPTSIRTTNNLCVTAKYGLCYKDDRSELFFVQNGCKNRNSQFRLTKNGILVHACTGNRVCRATNGLFGSKLVIDKRCTNTKALKFSRDGKLLCLKKNPNICIHPSGGFARDDVALVLWKTNKKQDNKRLNLLFTTQDCLDPLGMINGKITNRQITASSSQKHKDPMHGRLNGFNSWCAKIKNQDQYLQIDLGRVKHIGGIATEGTFDGKRVKDYKLFYSNDGKTWNEFTRTLTIKKNSCCRRGMCTPTARKNHCPSRALIPRNCPKVFGLACAGNGVCTRRGKCHCNNGLDPASNCSLAIKKVNGVWGTWTKWSKCDRVCDGKLKRRHRFCNNPAPSNGGRNCVGKRIQEQLCKTPKCPVVNSCRHLQMIGKRSGVKYPSGFYTINPGGQGNVQTYCDMTRNGGGWTLLVTSHTNTWTAANVRRRNTRKPSLKKDFSILYKADVIKDTSLGRFFEYRIEAQKFGHWGGIWKAPSSYSFVATNNLQTDIKICRKFGKWQYEDYGIERRMPWINGSMLTTSRTTENKYFFGSITANIRRFYPAPWINNKEQLQHPTNIWYWMRESSKIYTAKSCMDLQLIGIEGNKPLSNGVYSITVNNKVVKTFCDFRSDGGAWTLLLASSSRTGWTRKTLEKRNANNPSLVKDFSILGIGNFIIKNRLFQYKIEDGASKWGGIFEAESGQRLLSKRPQNKTRLLKKLLSNWDEKTSNLDNVVPYIMNDTLLFTTSTPQSDSSGTLVSSSNSSGTYIPVQNERPSVVRFWIREGTWRSCNEIVVKSGIPKKQYKDGAYMIKTSPVPDYLPVMCDMESSLGAWTLLVTSATNVWAKDQVKFRNKLLPSLSRDYSILGLGNDIKSLSGGKTFKYKLEANERGHWGGVWKAPIRYSFVATSNAQTNVTLIEQFDRDKWTYNKWDSTIEKRMPWIEIRSGKNKGLLTTSTHSHYYEYGSIISKSTINDPAPWIRPGMVNPGRIWYWVNEDDCDASRLPVHGGVSSWSKWSDCSPICGAKSQQTRGRTCTNPIPRCGGKECDSALLVSETRHCRYCPKSPIKGPSNFCIQPARGKTASSKCNPPDGTRLEYITDITRKCDKNHMYFVLGKDGILTHQCSGKKVCTTSANGRYGAHLELHMACPSSWEVKFEQTAQKGLKLRQTNICVHPNGGWANNGVKLILWTGCNNPAGQPNKLKLDLFQLAKNSRVVILRKKQSQKPKKQKPQKSRVSPIRSHGGLCLQPKTSTCSPSDGTEIVYHGTGGLSVQCDQNYMQFTLTKKGVLKHTCSNMYVCPDPTFKYDKQLYLLDATSLVLKKNGCSPNKAFYVRTQSKALMYKKTAYCVQKDLSGTQAVFSNYGCQSQDAILDFYKLK